MKKFNQLFEEAPAADYKRKVDDEEEVKNYKPRSDDEQKFVDMHKVEKKKHPVAPDEQHTGDRPKGKKGSAGEDHDGAEEKGEQMLKTYSQFMKMGGFGGDSYKGAGNSGGEKAPVMQGSSKIKEEVDLDEGSNDGYYAMVDAKAKAKKMGKVWDRMGQSEKDALIGPEMIRRGYKKHGSRWIKEEVDLDEGANDSYYAMQDAKAKAKKMGKVWDRMGQSEKDALIEPEMRRRGYKKHGSRYVREEVDLIDEAFRAGNLRLKDGKTVKIDKMTAESLNNAMKQLNSTNRKRMETEAMKDKDSFNSMVKFAKAAV